MENDKRTKNIISFILSERLLTITVIGSVFTFQFISSIKMYIIDPMFDFLCADDNFNFISITLRDGAAIPKFDKKITMEFGLLFKEFIKWIFTMLLLFLCAKYTRFPDHLEGNILGSAIM